MTYKHGVYDITDFIPMHPGADKLLMAAGKYNKYTYFVSVLSPSLSLSRHTKCNVYFILLFIIFYETFRELIFVWSKSQIKIRGIFTV